MSKTSILLQFALFRFVFVHPAEIEYPGKTASKIAFGSCHKLKDVNASDGIIWDAIRDLNPDAFLWTGDSVYPTQKGNAAVSNLRLAYDEMLENPKYGYSTFASSPPHLGIHGTWDDHDFGGNDRGKEMPDQSARRKIFFDFLNVHTNDPRRERSNGVYTSISFGDSPQKVLVLLLDTRSFRDKHCIPSVAAIKHIPMSAIWGCLTRWFTAGFSLPHYFDSCRKRDMLGEEQWQWLEKELQQSDAQAHIIVSSVQILTTNPIVESWCHFNEERQRLLRLLTNRTDGKEIPGIILISGDVHHAEISTSHPGNRVGKNENNPLLEVTSSGLTHTCEGPFYGPLCKPILKFFSAHRYQHMGKRKTQNGKIYNENFFTQRNFGLIEINWRDENDPIGTATVNVHDHYGRIVLSTGQLYLSSSTSLQEEEILNLAQCADGHLLPIGKFLLILFTSVTCTHFSLIYLRVRMKHWRKKESAGK